MDIRKTGLFISELRKQKGYTQKQLADKLNVTDKAISRWETGKGLPDTSLLTEIAILLGVSVGELLAGERIEEERVYEKTDNVIIDSLNYSKHMLNKMINGILIVIGILFLISPLFVSGKSFFIYSLIFFIILALRVFMERFRSNIKLTNITLQFMVFLMLIVMLILEILPYGIVLNFSPGPCVRVPVTYSYFSIIPYGYANFLPLPTICGDIIQSNKHVASSIIRYMFITNI